MFNSKYSKLLTTLLIVAIIVILIILVILGINWYNAYMTDADAQDGLDQFDGYVNEVIAGTTPVPTPTPNPIINNINNNTTIDPIIDVNNNTVSNGNTSGGSSGTTTTSRPKYKGFYMVGKIEIPKINVQYPVLERVTDDSIKVAVAVLSGPGINKVGNTVIIGHNYRNGTFFSNNKKLVNGDKIYLTDLSGKKVTYTIYKKYNTGSDDYSYSTRDTNGKREISLSTCTDDSKQRLVIWAREN